MASSQRTVLIEMGSGNGVGSPESEDRPAPPPWKRWTLTVGAFEDAVLVDWNW